MSQLALGIADDRTTGRGSVDHLERYYTPDDLARFCVDLLPWDGVRNVLEPHAGGGAFVRALEHRGVPVFAMDVDAECWTLQERAATVGDFLTSSAPLVDRVVGNPPFSNAEQHVDRGLEFAREVAFLLPMSRLDSARRSHWWQAAPLRHVWLIAERIWPGSRQCGFFWFDRAHSGPPTFEIVRWRA